MSIQKRWRFTETMVKDAPDCPGVYVLWSERAPLAVGAAAGAESIQSRLLGHLEHSLGGVTHYSWEICRAPRERAAEIERELGLAAREAQQA